MRAMPPGSPRHAGRRHEPSATAVEQYLGEIRRHAALTRDAEIVRLRLGLDGAGPLTPEELGERLAMPPAFVRRRLAAALGYLRRSVAGRALAAAIRADRAAPPVRRDRSPASPTRVALTRVALTRAGAGRPPRRARTARRRGRAARGAAARGDRSRRP